VDATTHQQQQSALLQINFANFKATVQATVGLAAMDFVVKDIALHLQAACKPEDTVARFGDDTYMVILRNTSSQAALRQAEHLAAALTEHIVDVDQKTLQLIPVIGVALVNETTANTQTIIEEAAQAAITAAAINESSHRIALYEPSLEQGRFSDQDIVRVVQNALDNNRFRLLFQPVINLRGAEEELYEVLLRMVNQDGAEIYPAEFFSAANRTGCSVKIDRWVILEAVRVLAEHRAKGNNTRLLINLTQQSLCDEGLPAWIGVVFRAADLCPDAVTFQCQEADITSHINAARKFYAAVATLGSKLSISHFGCALNPFNTLKHVHCDLVKVDGSFTQDIQNGNEGEAALKKLLGQLHELDKITIVPFVEHASVLSTLWQAGAHFIQGHYLQAPAAEMSYEFTIDS
jgi:diguanylate cyclase (GGDEF)-like protein